MNVITGKHHPKPEHTHKPEPTKSPCPEPTQSPTPEPTVTPTPEPTPEPTVTPQPSSTPTPTVTHTPTPTKASPTTIGTPVFPETHTTTTVPADELANTGADATTLPLAGGAVLAVLLGVVLAAHAWKVRRGH